MNTGDYSIDPTCKMPWAFHRRVVVFGGLETISCPIRTNDLMAPTPAPAPKEPCLCGNPACGNPEGAKP